MRVRGAQSIVPTASGGKFNNRELVKKRRELEESVYLVSRLHPLLLFQSFEKYALSRTQVVKLQYGVMFIWVLSIDMESCSTITHQ
jgi:hypothetical protein